MYQELSIKIIYLYLIFLCNIFFGYGFQILTFFNIPLNYIFLLLGIAIFKFNHSFLILKNLKLQGIILAWILFNLTKIIFGIAEHGLIAIRDASFSIDIFFLIITLNLLKPDDLINKFKTLLKYCFIILILFILLWFAKSIVREFDIIVTSPTGQRAYLFFNFQTLSILCLWFSFYLLIFKNEINKNKILPVFIFLALTIFTLVVFQRRYIYLIYISILILSLFLNPKKSLKLFLLIFFGLLSLPILNYINLIPDGYLGRADNISFFIDHLSSTFSKNISEYDAFAGARSTAEIRLFWWKNILLTNLSNYSYFFFGQDYGISLTNFIVGKSIYVREPHNMYLTIFARTGLIGSLIYIILTYKLIIVWIEAYKISRKKMYLNENKILLFLMVYIISIYIGNISDSMLTSNYYSIIFNISWAIIIIVYLKLKKKINENFTNS
tara:strand:+ start:188 stop:1507 length:1320 start_codon:yes stop_codon:yes gene_type:complete